MPTSFLFLKKSVLNDYDLSVIKADHRPDFTDDNSSTVYLQSVHPIPNGSGKRVNSG